MKRFREQESDCQPKTGRYERKSTRARANEWGGRKRDRDERHCQPKTNTRERARERESEKKDETS